MRYVIWLGAYLLYRDNRTEKVSDMACKHLIMFFDSSASKKLTYLEYELPSSFI